MRIIWKARNFCKRLHSISLLYNWDIRAQTDVLYLSVMSYVCVISHGSSRTWGQLSELSVLGYVLPETTKEIRERERETEEIVSDCCHVWCDNESNPSGELHTCSIHISWLNGKVNANGNRCTGNPCDCSHVHKRPGMRFGRNGKLWGSVSVWVGARLQIDPQFSEDKDYLERHKNKRLRFNKRS